MLDAARSGITERQFSPHLIAQAQADIEAYQNRLGLTKAERDEFWKSNYNPEVLASIQARHEGKSMTHEQIAENQLAILEGKKRKFTAEEKAWLTKNNWDVRKLHDLNKQLRKAPAIAATVAPKPAPAATRPTATASKTAAAPVPKLTTAAEFAEPDKLMLRTEWEKLSAPNKSRWVKTGGKLTNK